MADPMTDTASSDVMSDLVPEVLTVTVNPALDVSMTVDHLIPERKLRAVDDRREAGGGGVNVARVLDRLGVEARALAVAGGHIGDELLTRMRAEGLRVVEHRIDETTRESVAITEASTGRQYRFSVRGPTVSDPEALQRRIVEQAASARIVVLSGGLPPGLPDDFYCRVLAGLGDGPLTIVDSSPPALTEVATGNSPTAYLIKPSQNELARLVGWEPSNAWEIERAATEVLARGGVTAVVASRGPSGAVLVTREAPPLWFRPPPVRPVSTVGAGDSMVGGITAGLCGGLDLSAAVRLGVAAGTAAVMTPASELCRPDDVERFVDQVVLVPSVGPWIEDEGGPVSGR
jgi:6-phosphofructokinase 2